MRQNVTKTLLKLKCLVFVLCPQYLLPGKERDKIGPKGVYGDCWLLFCQQRCYVSFLYRIVTDISLFISIWKQFSQVSLSKVPGHPLAFVSMHLSDLQDLLQLPRPFLQLGTSLLSFQSSIVSSRSLLLFGNASFWPLLLSITPSPQFSQSK